ncbi:sulfur transfer protein TusE, partial [Salmonella enterica subsp. enterica serovar Enteritidis str. 76-2651]
MLIFEGKEISTDSEGYLKETTQWSETLAVAIAAMKALSSLRNTGKSCASCANFTWSL